MEPAVSIRDLTYTYRGQKEPALNGVSLEVAEGEFVVVMGHSGAGKSTLCTSLNGLIPHFFRGRMEGEVRVEGRSTREGKVGEFADEVGLVFQDFEAQLFSTNVALEVAFGPENFQVEREEMVRRVESVLGQVRLEGFEGRQPATLSGGQKQRLAIASVLAIEPRILCLDEPTTDLDPVGKLGIFRIAEELKSRDDVTLIVVEHETEETLDADRIVVLRGGKILADRPAREILQDVTLLEESSVMPLGVARFFRERGVEKEALPLTPEEGVKEFEERGWQVSPERHRELVAADEAREESYGETLIDVEGLRATSSDVREVRHNVEEFTTLDGRRLHLVGGGMVVNLTAGDGHPVEIMDLTFAIQALCAHHLANKSKTMENRVHLLPKEIDDEVASIKLDVVEMGVDSLTPEQERFLTTWLE